MDPSGRPRSRLARASGLRPPSVRVRAEAAAGGTCPAATGTAPCPSVAPPTCPGAAAPAPSRLPQSRMPRPASRLPAPSTVRAASPVRTRPPSPQRVAAPQVRSIPKPSGLRPPASYVPATRIATGSGLPRAAPQPRPSAAPPAASTVPVARVVARAPRAPSPERTVVVPAPRDSPAVAAAAAAPGTPTGRRMPKPSLLRRPSVRRGSLVAVPVVQQPGLPPKRILVPESVATSDRETRAEENRRLSMEGAAALPLSPVPRQKKLDQALMDDIDRRWEQLQRRLSLEGEGSPLVSMPREPPKAADVIDEAVATAATALHEQEKQEEDKVAAALRYLHEQRRNKYIDDRWDELQRSLYGEQYRTAPTSRIPATQDERWEQMVREASRVPLIEEEEMPQYYSPTSGIVHYGGEAIYPEALLSEIERGSDFGLKAIEESEAREGASGFIEAEEEPDEFAFLDMIDAYDGSSDFSDLDLEESPKALPALLPPSPTRARRMSSPLKLQVVTPSAGGTCCPTSPVGSPNRPTSPFSMSPLRRESIQFVEPDDLQEEEDEDEEEEEDLYKILKY